MLIRRIAAVSLAAGWYRAEHGNYPPTLQQLVPDYLSAVPADPFAPDGGRLMYRLAEDGKRPMLGSVGPDGVEETDLPLPGD